MNNVGQTVSFPQRTPEGASSFHHFCVLLELESPARDSTNHVNTKNNLLQRQRSAECIPPPSLAQQCRYPVRFSALHRNWFSRLRFHFSTNRLHPQQKKEHSPVDREHWPATLNFKVDLDTVRMKKACRVSRSRVNSFEIYSARQSDTHTHTHTHTVPIARPGPQKQSVKNPGCVPAGARRSDNGLLVVGPHTGRCVDNSVDYGSFDGCWCCWCGCCCCCCRCCWAGLVDGATSHAAQQRRAGKLFAPAADINVPDDANRLPRGPR